MVEHAPTATQIALFEELIAWIDEDGSGRITQQEPMRKAIRARPASFEVFRSYHGPEVRDRHLKDLPYGDVIQHAAARYGLDALLIASIVAAESSFDPCVVSPRGAVGLMQVMPATAGMIEYDRLSQPELNIDLGTAYLRHLLKLYEGDLELALAAYNAGPSNVRRYGGVPPFRETQQYVEKVLAAYVRHHQDVWRINGSSDALGLSG